MSDRRLLLPKRPQVLLLLLPLAVLVLLNATIFLLWRARARAPASPGPVVESVEKLSAPSTSGALLRGCPEIRLVRPFFHSYLNKPQPCLPGA